MRCFQGHSKIWVSVASLVMATGIVSACKKSPLSSATKADAGTGYSCTNMDLELFKKAKENAENDLLSRGAKFQLTEDDAAPFTPEVMMPASDGGFGLAAGPQCGENVSRTYKNCVETVRLTCQRYNEAAWWDRNCSDQGLASNYPADMNKCTEQMTKGNQACNVADLSVRSQSQSRSVTR